MFLIKNLTVGILFLLFLPGCAIQGYSGSTLPDEQLVSIALKKPTLSLIPLFWVFPFNMLTWFAEDWYETSWSGGDIVVQDVDVDDFGGSLYFKLFAGTSSLHKVPLSRFATVLVLPGQRSITTTNIFVLHEEQTGSGSLSTGSCTCTETETKDKKKRKDCQQTTTTSTPYRITAQDKLCSITFDAKAGRHYEAFIRDDRLLLQNDGDQNLTESVCDWQAPYSYDTTKTDSITSSCYP